MNLKKKLKTLEPVKFYLHGKHFYNDPNYLDSIEKSKFEKAKQPLRSEVINFLLSQKSGDTIYLEIGVRHPTANFNLINAKEKYSVDPGVEFKENPVDFKMTSDEFFQQLSANEILSSDIKFDVIFIDGLHMAEQVDRDIVNALKYIKDDGYIVLHDCNPPTEWHARENFNYSNTPAERFWNGTTWKAFLKWRCEPSIYSCCIDTDWGVGILSKNHPIGDSIELSNPFFEYYLLNENRTKELNLIDFDSFKKKFA